MVYNWQQKDWPEFIYDVRNHEQSLLKYGVKTGHISGLLQGLSKKDQTDAIIEMMVFEAMKTSEIEGEFLSREDVFSSIKKNLGIKTDKKVVTDERAKGISELIVTIHNTYNEPLSEAMLFEWHTILMSGNSTVNKGKWRTGKEPMQVVSGTIGREIVHFEAPPSDQVNEEMKQFIKWFNTTAPGQLNSIQNPLVRSAITHVYFETIHPFEDGNGRIGRALSEKAISQGTGQPVIISLSKNIEQNKKKYYNALEQAQHTLDLTQWLNYFIQLVLNAQNESETIIKFSLKKARFFDQFQSVLNKRQLKVIQRMLKEGPEGFEGGMSAKKYMSITKASKATATRDLQSLCKKSIFKLEGGGRSISYQLII
jgi:Fic family protein